jgi:hypothetical protein
MNDYELEHLLWQIGKIKQSKGVSQEVWIDLAEEFITRELLKIRNKKNDGVRLDLHELHK